MRANGGDGSLRLSDLAELTRPRQWVKNLAVAAALLFAGGMDEPELVVRTAVAFAAFVAVSAGLYALNDAIDAGRDRAHPVKRTRPVADGRVSRGAAVGVAVALVTPGVVIAAVVGVAFLGAVLTFIALQVAYSRVLKDVLIVDILTLAAGFTIRAVAGAWAIGVAVSPWLVLCAGMLALFLGAAKRRHELVLLGEERGAEHRPVLAQYSAELLDGFMVTLSSAIITTYSLYTFFAPHGRGYAMMATVPFVIYGVLRYQYLVLREGAGGRPEDVLLGDRPILAAVALWALSAAAIIYVVPPG